MALLRCERPPLGAGEEKDLMHRTIKDSIISNLDQAADHLLAAAAELELSLYPNEAADLRQKAEQIENRRGILKVTILTGGQTK